MNEVAEAARTVSAPGFYPRGVLSRRRPVALLLVLAAVVLLALFGWSWERSRPQVAAPAAGQAPSVSGVVVQEGGPLPLPGRSDTHPLPFIRLVVSGATVTGAHLNRRVLTDGHGRFALKLPPGVYRVTAFIYSPAGNGPSATVRVKPGHNLLVRLTSYVN